MAERSRTILAVCLLLAACAAPAPATPTEVELILPTPGTPVSTCSSFELQPTPRPGSASRFPAVSDQDHIRGDAGADVTLIVYNDFQCSDCNYLPLSRTLLERHPTSLRIVYRPYPYSAYFDKADLAARAAEAAGEQGRFWELHDLLFEGQDEWTGLGEQAFQTWLTRQASQLGMDPQRFEADLNSQEVTERVHNASEQGAELDIPILPLFLLNGQIYTGPTDSYSLDRVISLIALGKRQIGACPPFVIDPEHNYLATLKTEHGEIVVQLFADKAPLAVNSFVFLARQGWYDDITFHYVVPDLAAQSGDPSGTGEGNPGYLFEVELPHGLKFDRPGRVGLFNSGPNTNGSQFFITYQATPDLDGKYTIFGQVLSGLDALAALTPREEQPGEFLPPGDRLISVTIEER